MPRNQASDSVDILPDVAGLPATIDNLVEEEVAFVALDRHGLVRRWNGGAERCFGYTEAEVLGFPASFMFTHEDCEGQVPEEELRACVEIGCIAGERYLMRKDGVRLWASGVMTAQRDVEGRLHGFSVHFRNITHRRQVESRLREQQHRTASAAEVIHRQNHALRDELTESHHRIKNEFQNLASLLEVQIGRKGDAATGEDYRKVAIHVRAMAAIHDLLTQGAASKEAMGTLDLKQSIERLLPFIQRTIPERSIRWEVESVIVPHATAATVSFLVSELFSNAIKHGKGEISLRLCNESGTGRTGDLRRWPRIARRFRTGAIRAYRAGAGGANGAIQSRRPDHLPEQLLRCGNRGSLPPAGTENAGSRGAVSPCPIPSADAFWARDRSPLKPTGRGRLREPSFVFPPARHPWRFLPGLHARACSCSHERGHPAGVFPHRRGDYRRHLDLG